jgi:hypothetical protein
MDPFSSPPPSGSAEGPSNEVVMDKVKQQLAQAYAEEFFSWKKDKNKLVKNKVFALCSLSRRRTLSSLIS